ncbi:MAG: hypothetical protein IJ306_04120 [Oscillospiraceae bacterium]|nr:hypothetical protein [Oscillospiraceae bacterium]
MTEKATVTKLLAEVFKNEKVKKRLVAVMIIVVVAALCLGGYIGKEVELDNFDYVYIGGFYYQFEVGNENKLVDERFLTECIGEVVTTGVRRNEIRNQNGDSNVYPVGAKIYKLDTEDEEYQEEYASAKRPSRLTENIIGDIFCSPVFAIMNFIIRFTEKSIIFEKTPPYISAEVFFL